MFVKSVNCQLPHVLFFHKFTINSNYSFIMANRLIISLKNLNFLAPYNLLKVNNCVIAASIQQTRDLYSKTTLGIDGFVAQKERTKRQLENISEKFKHKMLEYSQEDSKNMIFTEDLKNMIHISESDEDIELVIKMMKRFNQQNKQLRFGNYIFGTVVMRLFHVCNKADLAFECFKMPELSGFFDQLMSYQILLDLLFENQKYDEILEAVSLIKSKQIEGSKYPRNIVVLALAACYKLNSKESLEYALKLWQELKDVGHFPMRRATTFCAGLALNQGQPGIAMEILTLAKNQGYTTVRNLKVAALVQSGRVEDAIPILKSVLYEDTPTSTVHTFNQDILDNLKNAIAKLDNPDIALEFNRIQEIFQKQGHISDTTLDKQLCQEIQTPPVMNNRQSMNQQTRFNRPREGRQSNSFYTYHKRPGLEELV